MHCCCCPTISQAQERGAAEELGPDRREGAAGLREQGQAARRRGEAEKGQNPGD